MSHQPKQPINIVEETQAPKTNQFVVIGLPDTGLVGIIAAGHLIEFLKMKEIGYIDSDHFPPIVVLHNGQVKNPLRIYSGDGITLVVSEVPMPPRLVNEFGKAIVEWVQQKNAKLILTLGGIPVPNRVNIETPEVFAVGIGEKAGDIIKKAGVKPLEEGMMAGPYASILWQCKKRNVPIVSLLAQSFAEYPDPGAAAAVLETLSKVIDKKIEVKDLAEKAEEIRVKTRDLMKQTGKNMQEMGKAREYEIPPLYA
nr:proteasome assembly chaperone family protein [Candidatus Njordarchaeum guaymaensis]